MAVAVQPCVVGGAVVVAGGDVGEIVAYPCASGGVLLGLASPVCLCGDEAAEGAPVGWEPVAPGAGLPRHDATSLECIMPTRFVVWA